MGDGANFNFVFQNLFPSSTYSLWCNRIKLSPYTILSEAPCGTADGVQSTFRTDSGGNAIYNLSLHTLPASGATEKSVVALVLNSDNVPHGSVPGNWGQNAHTQLLFVIPTKAEYSKQIDKDGAMQSAACIANAVDKRDESILKVFQTYHTALEDALKARRGALVKAWNTADATARKTAVKTATNTYNDTVRAAWKVLRTDREDAWKIFRVAQKLCRSSEKFDDLINEKFDAAL
jgi:hypothetical protein